MKQLVEMIARSLVDYPNQVHVNETAGESIVILEINVAQEDVGKVIGKEGRIANAIRTVVKAAAAKNDKKVTVEIMSKREASAQEPVQEEL
ncbi:MAG: KH domain-containing protein [Candidatus Margulisiibacteriota bacterium]